MLNSRVADYSTEMAVVYYKPFLLNDFMSDVRKIILGNGASVRSPWWKRQLSISNPLKKKRNVHSDSVASLSYI